jgi:hypothetical protein
MELLGIKIDLLNRDVFVRIHECIWKFIYLRLIFRGILMKIWGNFMKLLVRFLGSLVGLREFRLIFGIRLAFG